MKSIIGVIIMSVMDGVNRLTQLVGRNRLELLMFHLGSKQRFGINVFKVREILKCPSLTRIPNAHPVVHGITNMRGKTIVVSDLSAAVGRAPLSPTSDNVVIVTEYNRHVQGFLVSAVDRIVNKNWEEIHPPPVGLRDRSYLTAVTQIENELVEIIDVEKIFSDISGLGAELHEDYENSTIERTTDSRSLFFVDDSSVARKQMSRVFDQLKIPYQFAENGKLAYQKLLDMVAASDKSIDQQILLVISDIEMPEMDGYTLTKKIKEHPELSKLKVCLHSSLSGNFNESMIKRVGADYFVAKFDPDELARFVLEQANIISGQTIR